MLHWCGCSQPGRKLGSRLRAPVSGDTSSGYPPEISGLISDPLCAKHHRTGNDSYHRLGPRKFSEKHKLDIPAIVRRLNLKPTIRVEAGWFVTYFDERRYVLGKIDAGIRPAVH